MFPGFFMLKWHYWPWHHTISYICELSTIINKHTNRLTETKVVRTVDLFEIRISFEANQLREHIRSSFKYHLKSPLLLQLCSLGLCLSKVHESSTSYFQEAFKATHPWLWLWWCIVSRPVISTAILAWSSQCKSTMLIWVGGRNLHGIYNSRLDDWTNGIMLSA